MENENRIEWIETFDGFWKLNGSGAVVGVHADHKRTRPFSFLSSTINGELMRKICLGGSSVKRLSCPCTCLHLTSSGGPSANSLKVNKKNLRIKNGRFIDSQLFSHCDDSFTLDGRFPCDQIKVQADKILKLFFYFKKIFCFHLLYIYNSMEFRAFHDRTETYY